MSCITDELICPLCGDLLNDAVMLPCCASSTCDICARDSLRINLEGGLRCPLEECSSTDISAEDLIPNRRLRQKASTFRQQYPDTPNKNLNVVPVITNKTPERSSSTPLPIPRAKELSMYGVPSTSDDISTKKEISSLNDTSLDGCENSCDKGDSKSPTDWCAKAVSKLELEMLQTKEFTLDSKKDINKICDTGNFTSQQHKKHLNAALEPSIKCGEPTPLTQDVPILAPSATTYINCPQDLIEKAKSNNVDSRTESKMVTKEIEIEINLNDSECSEPPVPGEESDKDLIGSEFNSGKSSSLDKSHVNTDKSDGKREGHNIENSPNHNESRPTNGLLFNGYKLEKESHKIDIPQQYLNEAIEDPLAVFNKLMAVKDREKGILNPLEHYGPPRQISRSRYSPVRNHMYYGHPEYATSRKHGYSYPQTLPYIGRSSYRYDLCYGCDRPGHAVRDCPERYLPRRPRYYEDYHLSRNVRRTYDDRVGKNDKYHTWNKRYERRSISCQGEVSRKGLKRKSGSPTLDLERQKSPTKPIVDENSPSNSTKEDKPELPIYTSKQKKVKHEIKHDCTSPDSKRRAKKRKDKKGVKELDINENDTTVHDHSTKKKKSKKKKVESSNNFVFSSNAHTSNNENTETEKIRIKKKKKKSDRALDILDDEIIELLSKDYHDMEKELFGKDITCTNSLRARKKKISKKDKNRHEKHVSEKHVSKSYKSSKRESKHKTSISTTTEFQKLKEEQRKREEKRQEKKYRK